MKRPAYTKGDFVKVTPKVGQFVGSFYGEIVETRGSEYTVFDVDDDFEDGFYVIPENWIAPLSRQEMDLNYRKYHLAEGKKEIADNFKIDWEHKPNELDDGSIVSTFYFELPVVGFHKEDRKEVVEAFTKELDKTIRDSEEVEKVQYKKEGFSKASPYPYVVMYHLIFTGLQQFKNLILIINKEVNKIESVFSKKILSESSLYGPSTGLRFKKGDRVMLDPDTHAHIFLGYKADPGEEGTVDEIEGFFGRSIYPDPLKRMIFVWWDNGSQEGIYKQHLKKVPKNR